MRKQQQDPYIVAKEQQVYKRYLHVWNRTVTFPPDGRLIDWDVVGHGPTSGQIFNSVFVYHTEDQNTVTLVKEYMQGPNCVKYAVPGGKYDPNKHSSILESAQAELSEEVQLRGGKWISLLSGTFDELKWSTNKVSPYLVIDPVQDAHPAAADAEEQITICRVPVEKLKEYILSAQLMLVSIQTSILALNHLKEAKINVGLTLE